MELNDKTYNEIVTLSEQGDELVDCKELLEAIEKYNNALELLPNPKYIWEASTWIYTAIGDTYFLNNQFQEALDFLFESLKCPDGLENPFVLLRIGECFYELKGFDKAKEYLLQAYMYDGMDIFEGEDVKYFDVIKYVI